MCFKHKKRFVSRLAAWRWCDHICTTCCRSWPTLTLSTLNAGAIIACATNATCSPRLTTLLMACAALNDLPFKVAPATEFPIINTSPPKEKPCMHAVSCQAPSTCAYPCSPDLDTSQFGMTVIIHAGQPLTRTSRPKLRCRCKLFRFDRNSTMLEPSVFSSFV